MKKTTLDTILLIDDEVAINYYHSIILRDLQCVELIIPVNSGEEALQLLDEGLAPDLVLVDIEMLRMDGWAFIEHVRNHDKWHKVDRIVIATASYHFAGEERAQKLGVKAYLHKPLDEHLMLQLLEN